MRVCGKPRCRTLTKEAQNAFSKQVQAVRVGRGSTIQATVYDDAVRFTVQNDRVEILRAKVFDLGGKRLFDSGPTMGNALDWTMTTEAGERVAHGVYLYVITAWNSGGQLLNSQVGKRMFTKELSYHFAQCLNGGDVLEQVY